MDARGQYERCGAHLHNLYLPLSDEKVEGAAAYAKKLAGIGYPPGYWINRLGANMKRFCRRLDLRHELSLPQGSGLPRQMSAYCGLLSRLCRGFATRRSLPEEPHATILFRETVRTPFKRSGVAEHLGRAPDLQNTQCLPISH